MPAIHINTDTCTHAETGVSLLDAVSSAGKCIPYSCRSGRCSTCKCLLIDGETVALSTELGLSAAEKAEGWILSCVRTAVSDVSIVVDLLEGVALPPARTLPCRIDTIDHLAPDVISLRLRLPPSSAFDFLPGQYIELIGPNGLRRSYSLASTSTPLELHVRAVADGVMSRHLFQHAQANDVLRLYGPLGTFFLRDVAGLDLIFLATGTGIAPVKAMLEALPTNDAQPRSVTVLWGGRQPEDLYLDIASIVGTHTFIPVLSRADTTWDGARGHVQDVLLAHQPDLTHAAVYACGSDAMIHSARTTLIQAGLPERRFYSDAFVCSSTVATATGH